MKKEKDKKPIVVLELDSEKLLTCSSLSNKNCIAHQIIEALMNAGNEKEAKRFTREYENKIKDKIFDEGLSGFYKKFGYISFSEFFKLADKYVDLRRSREFDIYAQDSDEERRIYGSLQPWERLYLK